MYTSSPTLKVTTWQGPLSMKHNQFRRSSMWWMEKRGFFFFPGRRTIGNRIAKISSSSIGGGNLQNYVPPFATSPKRGSQTGALQVCHSPIHHSKQWLHPASWFGHSWRHHVLSDILYTSVIHRYSTQAAILSSLIYIDYNETFFRANMHRIGLLVT